MPMIEANYFVVIDGSPSLVDSFFGDYFGEYFGSFFDGTS